DPDCPPEAERHLPPKGIARTRAAAKGLLALGIRPHEMLTSPYLRAAQTAEITCAVLNFPIEKIRRTDALKPEVTPALFFEDVARLKADEVMCFGHAPNMDELKIGRAHV